MVKSLLKTIEISFLEASRHDNLAVIDKSEISLTGPFAVAAKEFTRDPLNKQSLNWRSEKRVFKPGLEINFEGKKYLIPDITFQQYKEALSKATPQSNGVLMIDLSEVQKKNRTERSFKGRKISQGDVREPII